MKTQRRRPRYRQTHRWTDRPTDLGDERPDEFVFEVVDFGFEVVDRGKSFGLLLPNLQLGLEMRQSLPLALDELQCLRVTVIRLTNDTTNANDGKRRQAETNDRANVR